MSEERVDPNDRLLVTAHRALGIVEKHGGIGEAGKNPRIARTMDVALVELMVENIKAGYVQKPEYLRRPTHLPDSDRELRVLHLSQVAKDQTLKADLFEWAQINRRIAGQAAVTLRNAITAVRLAESALDAGDDNDVEIHEWKVAIEEHLYRTFAITAIEAPVNVGELGLWCEDKLAEMNPVPEWMRDARAAQPGSMFQTKKSTKPNLLKIVKGDDDE